ncbi:MAG TPA: MEDS domain-containing protein [Candidatus Obscuribacterales bacterium]
MTQAANGKSLLEALYQVAPHDHLCLIYETEEEQLLALLPYIQFGLEQGQKCLYIGNPDSLNTMMNAMKERGIAVDAATTSGALCLLSEKELGIDGGRVNPEAIVSLLKDRAKSAAQQGFTGVRATLDMCWVLSNASQIEQLIRCEAKLATSIHATIASALCQYRRDVLSPDLLKGALITHPKVIIGRSAHDNRGYLPPQRAVGCDHSNISLKDLLGNFPVPEGELFSEADSAAMRKTDRLFKAPTAERPAVLPHLISSASLPVELVQQGPLPIFEVNADLVVTAANQAFINLVALPVELIFGARLADLVPSIPTEPLKEALHDLRPFQMGSCKIVCPHQLERKESYCDLVVWPTGAQAGSEPKLCILAWEVTDHMALVQQREDFMAILAHNLNPPLLGDHRALEILLSGVLGELQPRQAEVVSLLRKSNVSQMKMVQDLLEVFRYETGTKDLTFKEINLCSVLDNCISEVRPLAERIDLQIIASLPDSLYRIEADSQALQRLFVNLLSNAVKFSPNGGVIEVTGKNSENTVVISVKDSGTGVPPQDEPKLFERFWHGGGGASPYPARTGVGLYLCRKIVEAHQGEIKYARVPEVGSVFSVTLPVRHSSREASYQVMPLVKP